MTLTPDLLHDLEPRLRRLAGALARTTDNVHDADDLFQEMTLCLIENAHDPRLSSPARITTRAAWHARHCCESARTYRRYNLPMLVVVTEDGEALDYSELIPDEADSPEEALIAKQDTQESQTAVKRILPSLPPIQQQIALLLMQGLGNKDIATALGFKRPGTTVCDNLVKTRGLFLLNSETAP